MAVKSQSHPHSPVPVALYARVSTRRPQSRPDGRLQSQDPENQLQALRQHAAGHPDWIVTEYIDRETGTKGEDTRQAYRMLMADIRSGKVKLVLVWALDRFSREGALPVMQTLAEMATHGCDWYSLQEPVLNVAGPFKDVLVSLFATMAKIEAGRHKDRVHAGLARARAQGKHIGRRHVDVPDAVMELIRQGKSLREVEQITRAGGGRGISRATLARVMRHARQAGQITRSDTV